MFFKNYYDSGFNYGYTRNRINGEISDSQTVEFATNFIKKFKKDGHKLTFDGSFSKSDDE